MDSEFLSWSFGDWNTGGVRERGEKQGTESSGSDAGKHVSRSTQAQMCPERFHGLFSSECGLWSIPPVGAAGLG